MAQTENASITPVFYTEIVKDENASRLAGRPIMVPEDRVEYRIAGNRHFNPHFQAHEFHEMVEGETITHAMRWPNEYKRFKETGGNVSKGTPLENLPGLTPVQKSTLKALSVYSIEGLASIEGRELKNLGPGGHEMKRAATQYLSAAGGREDMASVMQQLAALKAQNEQLARIVEASKPTPVEQVGEESVSEIPEFMAPQEEPAVNPLYELDESVLKDRIEALAGSRPRGNPNKATLVGMLTDLEAAQ